jgi:antitoxin component of MazEF toxin-antitoxin module
MTSDGQIRLEPEMIEHLGLTPGRPVEIVAMPNGTLQMSAVRRTGDISAFFGMLKREGQRSVSIEEMNDVIAKDWAGLL